MPWCVDLLRHALAGAVLVSAPVHAAPLFPTLSDVRPLALSLGVNMIPGMGPGGRDGMIVEAHRDYLTADGSYDVFLAMIRYEDGKGWSLVTHGGSITDDPADPQTFTDAPHAGDDVVRSVRFARARMDGRPTFVALTAERALEGPIPSPSHVAFTLYRLVERTQGDGGYMFLKGGEAVARACYGNADLALHAELGVPLPAGYEGPHAAGVCGAE